MEMSRTCHPGMLLMSLTDMMTKRGDLTSSSRNGDTTGVNLPSSETQPNLEATYKKMANGYV
jgi:hypothetical protein